MELEKKKVKHLSFKESLAKLSIDSRATARTKGHYTDLDLMQIEFSGSIAKVPSLKNQKMKGTNVLRPVSRAHLHLMTVAMQSIFKNQIPKFKKDEKIFCLISFSYRPNFDEDNPMSTIKDWLEPSFIRKKDRGWGVGIVDNDKQINAFATKKKKDAPDRDVTTIYLIKESLIEESKIKFLLDISSQFS